jgi:hypothetical protein
MDEKTHELDQGMNSLNGEGDKEGAEMTYEGARQEVEAWLDEKKVSPTKRQNFDDHIDTLATAVLDGWLSRNKDGQFVQTLKFPVGEVKELTYKKRLQKKELKPYIKGVKQGDADGRMTAYICALTHQVSGIIDGLDSEDQEISNSIAVFFVS